MADTLEEINLDIFRESYANAKPSNDDTMISRVFWVRGWLPYDKETIHEYLEDTFVQNPYEVDSFSMAVVRNDLDYDRIAADISIGFETYEVGRSSRLIHFKRTNLTI